MAGLQSYSGTAVGQSRRRSSAVLGAELRVDRPGTNRAIYKWHQDGSSVPSETKLAPDANQALEFLADGETALDRTVVVGEQLQGPLTEAKLELFTIGCDRYHRRASSAGRSILLLPSSSAVV
jgi:hypothetical protein